MLIFEISGAQIYCARDYQEDAFLITHLGDSDSEGGSLVIVADGMGGHAAGNVASNMAVQTFNKHVTSNFPNENLAEVLRESVKQANGSISETVRETAALKGMGCTLVAAVMENKSIRWVSVGDNHLYLIRKARTNKEERRSQLRWIPRSYGCGWHSSGTRGRFFAQHANERTDR